MIYDKTNAMLESAGKNKKELPEAIGISKNVINYWLEHISGNFPFFYKFCAFCGYKIKLRKRDNPKVVINITKSDVNEDERVQYEKRTPIKKNANKQK